MEDQQWELYCALISNPFAEDIGTFDEFRKRCTANQRVDSAVKEVNQNQMEKQVKKAELILAGFKPSERG